MLYIVKFDNGGYLGNSYYSDIGDYGTWIRVPIVAKDEKDALRFITEENAYDMALDYGCNLDKIEVVKLYL